MNKVDVLVRGLSAEDFGLMKSMMEAAKIDNYRTIDILVQDINDVDTASTGIAMGKVCGRMVKDYYKTLYILPGPKQLRPYEANRKTRKEAWETLQTITQELQGEQKVESCSWRYATVCLPGQKKIIVYEDKKPNNVDGDVFISRKDSDTLLKLKEAFKAEAVIIGEEA